MNANKALFVTSALVPLGSFGTLVQSQLNEVTTVAYCQSSRTSQLRISLTCPSEHLIAIMNAYAATTTDITSQDCPTNPLASPDMFTKSCTTASNRLRFTQDMRGSCNFGVACQWLVTLPDDEFINTCMGSTNKILYFVEYQCMEDSASQVHTCTSIGQSYTSTVAHNTNPGYPQLSLLNSCTWQLIPQNNQRIQLRILDIAPYNSCPMFVVGDVMPGRYVCGNHSALDIISGDFGEGIYVRFLGNNTEFNKMWLMAQIILPSTEPISTRLLTSTAAVATTTLMTTTTTSTTTTSTTTTTTTTTTAKTTTAPTSTTATTARTTLPTTIQTVIPRLSTSSVLSIITSTRQTTTAFQEKRSEQNAVAGNGTIHSVVDNDWFIPVVTGGSSLGVSIIAIIICCCWCGCPARCKRKKKKVPTATLR